MSNTFYRPKSSYSERKEQVAQDYKDWTCVRIEGHTEKLFESYHRIVESFLYALGYKTVSICSDGNMVCENKNKKIVIVFFAKKGYETD